MYTFLTLIIAVAGVWAAYQAGKAAKEAGRAANAATGQVRAARDQVAEARKQTEIQAGLARAYFITTFSKIDFGGDTFPAGREPALSGGTTIIYGGMLPPERTETADFTVVGAIGNYGTLPGVIENGGIWYYVGAELPDAPLYEAGKAPPGWDWNRDFYPGPSQAADFSAVVAAKEREIPFSVVLHVVHHITAPAYPHLRADLWTQKISFFVYGVIRYSDQLGNRREYGFCRRYIPSDGALIKAGGDAYNFERAIKR